MKILKAFKYRLYPTKPQKILLGNHFGATRWVYNWCLARKTSEYTASKKNLSRFDLNKEVTALKKLPETSWLYEVNSQSLQCAIMDLDSAYTAFFRKTGKFPRFKSKKRSRESAQFTQKNKVNFISNKLYVMNFREGIKCNFHRTFDGELRSVTISKSPTGKYYASCLVSNEVEVPSYSLDFDKAIGIDLGVKSLAVTSRNEVFENPKYLAKSLRKLKKEQRKLTKKKLGSKNRNKQKVKVAKVYELVSNQRMDNLHKISRQLVDDSQVTTFCLEDLNVKGMMKNRKLSRAISDAGFSTLVNFIRYKAEWAGKNFLQIGRFEPSSRTCDSCGNINRDLKLSDRTWTCICGVTHDRDFLAARNIKTFAFHSQNLIGMGRPESKPVEKSALLGSSVKQEASCT